MKLNHNRNRINTTVGDLIAAITDAALECTDNTKDAYRLASVVLVEILKNAPPQHRYRQSAFLLALSTI